MAVINLTEAEVHVLRMLLGRSYRHRLRSIVPGYTGSLYGRLEDLDTIDSTRRLTDEELHGVYDYMVFNNINGAKQEAYDEGQQAGYDKGYADGYADGVDDR